MEGIVRILRANGDDGEVAALVSESPRPGAPDDHGLDGEGHTLAGG